MFHNISLNWLINAPVLVILSLFTSSTQGASRLAWENNGHSYQRIENEVTWLEAKGYCESQGGYLATVTSKEENEFIFSRIGGSRTLWLGGTDAGDEGRWTWVTNESWIYSNWDTGEPSNYNGNEHYLQMEPNGKWNDQSEKAWYDTNLYNKLWFVCEWESMNSLGNASVGVFRAGTWFLDANANGAWNGCQQDGGQDLCLYNSFGQVGDMPAAGNWDGGAKSSIGVLRSGTGEWFIDLNSNHQWDGCGIDSCYVGFGAAGDLPVAGDWNGTGFAKIGVFRNGQWFLDANGNGAWDGCDTDLCLNFGQFGDWPVAGNWDGGLKAGVGVFRAGTWYLDYNGNGKWDDCQQDGGQDLCLYGSFGQAGDLPVAGDWNDDGKAKVGVFRNGTWYLDYNGNGAWDGCVVDRCYEGSFGIKGDLPVAGRW